MKIDIDFEKFKVQVVTYFAMVVLATTSIIYTTISQHRTEQKFCAIVTSVNDAYKEYPEPTTELGKNMKIQYAQLENDLGCKRRL
jgi:hypothetical protein